MDIYRIFKNFTFLLMGCHDETFKNFRKSKKKIGDLHELDNFKQKLFFKIEIANVIFRTIFNKSKIFFDLTRFSETGSLNDQNSILKNFWNPQGDRENLR